MDTKRVLTVVLVLCVMIHASGGCDGTTLNSQTQNGAPSLVGNMEHDFGIIRLEPGGKELTHTFTLENHTDRTITITDSNGSCGCAVAELSDVSIEPEQSLEVHVKLRLASPKKKSERIWLIIDDDEVVTLRMYAQAVRTDALLQSAQCVDLKNHESAELLLHALSEKPSDAPSPPKLLSGPSWLAAEIGEWHPVDADAQGAAIRHTCTVRLQADRKRAPADKVVGAVAVFSVDEHRVTVYLDGSPWHTFARPN